MSAYVLSAEAEFDLDEIWEYIALDSIDAADRWVGKLFAAFEFARSPGIGHKREDLTGHPALFWPVSAYLIVYRIKSGSIEIVAVTQGARDIPSFLRRRAQ
jgi:plasmid stabilization system protein ParE